MNRPNKVLQTKDPILNSILCLKKYGAHKSEVQAIAKNIFTVPEHLKPCFDVYFLRSWNYDYFLEQLKSEPTGLFIYYQDRKFAVVFTKSRTRLQTQQSVFLSFRAVKPEFESSPCVLVS